MAEITAATVKELRERTGAGMMDCKKALAETNGEMEAAIDWLRTKGLAAAAKKSSRTAAEGLVGVAALFLIWWSLTNGIGSVVQSLQPKPVAASVPDPQPVPVPPTRAPGATVVARTPQQPTYRQPTAAEIAEWQRQSEESMRILERNTPEVPLALPGSPQVGPAAQ